MPSWKRNNRRRVAALTLCVGLLGVAVPAPAGADRVSDAKASVEKAQDYIEYLDEQVAILEADQLDAEQGLADAQIAVAESTERIGALSQQLAAIAERARRPRVTDLHQW